jgi:phosphate transport system protein
MIKGFMSLFSNDSLLDQALDDTHKMLNDVEQMVGAAYGALRCSSSSDLDIDISLMDKAVNRYESEVRRKVFTHLSVMGTENIYPALVLVSIIIDVERVGDYAKNIVDLARMHAPKLEAAQFEDELKRIEDSIIDQLLPQGRNSFENNDEELAGKLLHELNWINPACDRIAAILVSESETVDLSASDQVSLALYVRYLKRINSHWQNILTGLVNPFDRIGFRKDFFRRS